MIFHSYVKLPEGTHHSSSFCYLIIPHLYTHTEITLGEGGLDPWLPTAWRLAGIHGEERKLQLDAMK